MQRDQTMSQRLTSQAKDMREYQDLKVSNEMERDATRRLFESLRRKLGSDEAARAELKSRGYDSNLLK